MTRTIVWFRRDLRIADHAPLYRAALRGAVLPLFILDRALLHHPETASARVLFMLNCLGSLDQDLRQRGGRLIVRSGDPVVVLLQLIRETGAEGIYAHSDCERIYGRQRDARLNQALAQAQMKIRWFEPLGSTAELMPYPRYRSFWYEQVRSPLTPTPTAIAVDPALSSEGMPELAELGIVPDRQKPQPPAGTTAARRLLQDFLQEKCDRYYWQLSYPSAEVTTGLSPHLKFGVISIRECYQRIEQALQGNPDRRVQRTRRQLISRLRWGSGFTQRFRYLPQLELRSLYSVFDQDGWEFDEELYQAWRTGQTGFPIVDAAARCLMATGGWKGLNFRSRALYASFLSNLLGMDWRFGALHFMQQLIDGDCPIDHYQWAMQAGVTHCVDKTWTRIYNPGQAAIDRCDPEGDFIRRWVPELAEVAPEALGKPPLINGYPAPILDYPQARQRRVRQLEAQRRQFLQLDNLLPCLAPMPEDWTPFGSDRPSDLLSSDRSFELGWCHTQNRSLFPAALDLEALDFHQSQMLRTWFVAHVTIKPHAGRKKQRHPRRGKVRPSEGQLSLFDLGAWASDAVLEDSGLAGDILDA